MLSTKLVVIQLARTKNLPQCFLSISLFTSKMPSKVTFALINYGHEPSPPPSPTLRAGEGACGIWRPIREPCYTECFSSLGTLVALPTMLLPYRRQTGEAEFQRQIFSPLDDFHLTHRSIGCFDADVSSEAHAERAGVGAEETGSCVGEWIVIQ